MELCGNLTYDQRAAPESIFHQKIKDLSEKMEQEIRKVTNFYQGKISEIKKIVQTKERVAKI